jgi:hypothetical protein
MAELQKSANAVKSVLIDRHYLDHQLDHVSLDSYADLWKQWLSTSDYKQLIGLDEFDHIDYTQGTTQTFDQFVVRHAGTKKIVWLQGEFQYHQCITKNFSNLEINDASELSHGQALFISLPFSGLGKVHPQFNRILDICEELCIPVCVDLAYWGISKNIQLDLKKYQCIEEITSSLSKSFYVLANHRIGVRFSRKYLNDGISMLNEVNMQNFYSMSLANHFMTHFSSDWNWDQFGTKHAEVCRDLGLIPTDCVIFAVSNDDRYNFGRRTGDIWRVCLSEFLSDPSLLV